MSTKTAEERFLSDFGSEAEVQLKLVRSNFIQNFMNPNPAVLQQPLRLACGVELPNRLAKSAMSEQLGSLWNRPTPALIQLYDRWAMSGVGLLITGNVMVTHQALVESRNVVVEDDRDQELLRQWAQAGQRQGAQMWMQINHPGRQTPRYLSAQAKAPSDVAMQVAKPFFAPPQALTEAEILQIIAQFAQTAAIAQQVGFTGVQIHAAHGYLINQFLSPLTNLRTDGWGGTLTNRMRFLLEILQATRQQVGQAFPIGVKLNSADFQRGGFSSIESQDVVCTLAATGVDLIEISGGTYESPSMMGESTQPMTERTRQREAYFIDYVNQVRQSIDTPLMLTGGFRSWTGMVSALQNEGVDVIGLARPLAVAPDFPQQLLSQTTTTIQLPAATTSIPALKRLGMLELIGYTQHIQRLAAGKAPHLHRRAGLTLLVYGWSILRDVMLRRAWKAFQRFKPGERQKPQQ
jgi:2,4-dienoyl-CoA reductase-like NADH-dependent reductase (Old Yellow Enzyme family)